MQWIQLDKRRALAFGLLWSTTDALSRGEQLRKAHRDGARFMASFPAVKSVEGARLSDDNVAYGKPKDWRLPKGVKAYSAAGQLATHPKWRGTTVLALLRADSSNQGGGALLALVGLLRGNVILDAVASVAEAGRLIDAYRERCLQASQSYRAIGSVELAREPLTDRFDWSDFFPAASIERGRLRQFAWWRSQKPVEIQPLKQGRPLGWLVAGGLTLAAVSSFSYVAHMREAEEREMRERAAKEQQDPVLLYRDSVQRLLSTPILRAGTTVATIRESIKQIPVLLAGWKLKEIACTQAGCNAVWTRNHGTYAEFDASAWPEWRPLVLSEDLQTITHRVPVELRAEMLPDRETWPTVQGFLRAEASRWQRLTAKEIGLQIALEKEQIRAIPPGTEPSQFVAVPGLVYGANWAITSSPWWVSELFDQSPPNMTVSNLKVEFNGKTMSFTSNGIVYVRK
ncbi:type 4b pilus protein PilO2 [Cupriavidus gilardii]|nr:type 4b pilus protein PilO2 [Cupriavidus gilardii]